MVQMKQCFCKKEREEIKTIQKHCGGEIGEPGGTVQ